MRGQELSRSSMDSDLEGFSHNPADGSLAAMPDQTAAKTNYLNSKRMLCHDGAFIPLVT